MNDKNHTYTNQIDRDSLLGSNRNIHPSVKMGSGCVIHESVRIDEGTVLGNYVILEEDCVIGKNCYVGQHTVLRYQTIVGDETTISHLVCSEGEVSIGKQCSITPQVHITNGTIIEDKVFFGPSVTMGNDLKMVHLRRETSPFVRKAPIFKKGCRIGAGSVILPGIIIGQESFIGAGSVVTKDTKELTVYIGNPAKPIMGVPAKERLQW